MPEISASTMPMAKAGVPVMPRRTSTPCSPVSMRVIRIVPTPASVEPTARSMPPVMMTSVMPSAIMPTEVLARSTLKVLSNQNFAHAPTEPCPKPSA